MSENLKARDGFWGQFFKSTPFERILLKNSKFWPKIEGGVKFTKEFLLNEIYKFCSKKSALSNYDPAQLKYKISRMLEWLDGRNAPLPPKIRLQTC